MISALIRLMRPHFFLLTALQAILLPTLASRVAWGVADEIKSVPAVGEPLKLDTNAYYKKGNEDKRSEVKDFHGLKIIDGLEFNIGCRVPLYGQSAAARGKLALEAAKGILVGRRFDELHLIHHTYWPDVENEIVASIFLNYTDGSAYSFPLRYGVHIRDWDNLPSYEKESVTDPDTKICWRHAPYHYKAPVRLFKTKIMNPLPEKIVQSIDVVSAKNLASYFLLAATVVDSKDVAEQEFVGDRDFDNNIAIEVVDDVTGKPIAGALVEPSMYVLQEGVVGTPIRTNAKGTGLIPYSTKDTSQLFLRIKMDGYQRAGQSWPGPIPKQYTVRLKPAALLEPRIVLPPRSIEK